jgi:hypothetical protein
MYFVSNRQSFATVTTDRQSSATVTTDRQSSATVTAVTPHGHCDGHSKSSPTI